MDSTAMNGALQLSGGNLCGMPRKNRGAKLTVAEVAERVGVTSSTWRTYLFKARQARAAGKVTPSLAPEPDGQYDGRTPWWWESTIAEYMSSRRGQGWRAGSAK